MPRPEAEPYQLGEAMRAEMNARDAEILDYADEKSAKVASVVNVAAPLPVYVDTASPPGGAGNTQIALRPALAAVGDILHTSIQVWGGSAIAPPVDEDWVEVCPRTVNAEGFAMAMYYRIDDGSPGPWTFTTTAAGWREVITSAYRNIDPSDVLQGQSVVASTFGDLAVWYDDIDTVQAGSLVIAAFMLGSARSLTYPGAPWNAQGGFLDKIQAVTGSSGTPNIAIGDYANNIGQLTAYNAIAAPSSRDFVATDADKLLVVDVPSAIDLRIQPDPGSLEPGEAVNIANLSAGAVTVSPQSGVEMISDGGQTAARTLVVGMATLVKLAANSYMLTGSLAS